MTRSIDQLVKDRILHKANRSTSIECVAYDSVPGLTLSDHRPVYGMYKISLKPGRDRWASCLSRSFEYCSTASCAKVPFHMKGVML